MKLTTSFVLALAAAWSATASPVLRRQQQSSSSDGLPTPSAVLPSGSSMSAPTFSSTSSMSMSSASGSAAPAPTPSAGAAPGAAGGANSTSSGTTFNDTEILQYALTLEHLEATFYNQSLSKLSASDFESAGYNSSVRDRIYSIGRDEAAHVAFLSSALGNDSIPACTYNFSSVTDVPSFLATARVLEGVGVSAYLGAAGNITNKDYLTAAGSILLVEGQHQSYLIAQTDDGGNSIPSPFATPLDFKQVYSLAAPFIASCPSNASLPITAFPTLSLSGGAANGSFAPGQEVTVSYDNSTSSSNGSAYLAIINGVSGPQFFSLDSNTVTLPSNLTGGQMYAVVTSSNGSVTDDNTIAGPAVGYVNVPLVAAPSATASFSSSSSSSSMSSSSASATSTGSAAAGPTGTASSDAQPTSTQSGSDTIVSSATDSPATESISSSLASLGSANLPQPTSTN